MIDINWRPSDRDLRIFATACLVVAGGFGVSFFLETGMLPLVKWLWLIGGGVFALGMVRPQSVRYLYVLLSVLVFPIGLVIGNVLMALVYYVLVTPVGLVFRLMRRDPLDRELDPEAKSHWVRRPPQPDASRYFRQF